MADWDFAAWIHQSNAGFWEFDVHANHVKWSDGFYTILGYETGELTPSYQYFLHELLYYEDCERFLNSINSQNVKQLQSVQIRLLTKRGFEWFESTMQKQKNARITGTLIPIHELKIAALKRGGISESQNWTLHFDADGPAFRGNGLTMINLFQQALTLNGFYSLLEQGERDKVESAITNCKRHSHPFELDLLIKHKWMRMKGAARIDQLGNCIEINGTFENIDLVKHKEIEIARQKDKLQNFAHIVAHNINNYANNLSLLLELHEQLPVNEREEIFDRIKGLSGSLKTTIRHLNEIINSEAQGEVKSTVDLSDVLNTTTKALQHSIQLAGASVTGDFSQCPQVYYSLAYLESIFHNLISNSLKYRDPSRKVIITCTTKKVNQTVYLTFQDNGVGIDMEKHGHRLFGMYQTFHQHNEARGLGLYITKNQIEQSGGAIHVESKPNKGTRFVIRLNALS